MLIYGADSHEAAVTYFASVGTMGVTFQTHRALSLRIPLRSQFSTLSGLCQRRQWNSLFYQAQRLVANGI